MPASPIDESLLVDGKIDILTLVVAAELAPTKSEARRNVMQGGVSVNDTKITDVKATFTKDELKEGLLVQKGKKNFKKVTL